MTKFLHILALFFLMNIAIIISTFIACDSGSDDSTEVPTVTPTSVPSPTPTFNPATCVACHQFPPSSGSHNAHNGSFCCHCLQCHYTSVDTDYNFLEDHENGTVDVIFQAGGSWDGGGCFGLSSHCHGDRLW